MEEAVPHWEVFLHHSPEAEDEEIPKLEVLVLEKTHSSYHFVPLFRWQSPHRTTPVGAAHGIERRGTSFRRHGYQYGLSLFW